MHGLLTSVVWAKRSEKELVGRGGEQAGSSGDLFGG